MNEFKFKKADITDVASIIVLRKEMYNAMQIPLSDIEKIEDPMLEYFNNAIASNQFHAWVAIHNDLIVSTVGLVIDQHPPNPRNPSGKIGYIMNVSTLPDFRKRGLASKLIELILTYLKNENITQAALHTTDVARSIYEKYGFQNSPEMKVNL